MKNYIFFEQVPVGPYKNFSYILGDKDSRLAAVFDPAWDVKSLFSKLVQSKLTLKFIINTHAHFDHIEGNAEMKERTGAEIIMHEASKAKKEIGVKDGDSLKIGKIDLRFLHTPGHSPESMCITVDDFALITGDTLFIGECGRVDLPGGDAEKLYDSFERIRKLDPALVVYPGHDYGKTPSSTLDEQLTTNYTLAKRTREEFVNFMSKP
jgi:hydroxyacylglutathione hydrolase